MKPLFLSATATMLLLTACEKEMKPQTSVAATATVSNLEFTDTVKVPLTDLATGTYYGFTGGLYPDGENTPSGQYATDLDSVSASVVPLDANGNYSPSGKIGFISIGASTCSIMMNNLRKKTKASPLTNPLLLTANCTGGGESIQEINDTITNAYWNVAFSKLAKNNLTAPQVQVVYLETDDSISVMSFPERPLNTRQVYTTTLQILLTKFPNLKVVYLLGRTTTFLGTGKKQQNREPGPYYNGWGCKFLIAGQINNEPELQYKGVERKVPMVTWGWYQWSVGYQPRNDGFLWTKELTRDGLHANDQGANILSANFMNFLLNDPYASKWYAKH
ncbi:hypothetical protein I5907_03790 [Panacibacter sp. DH6]|uniref:Uncharacterized protein n=1 Tax=Panacibacter microcysteis TaxID=2793269 RepID=A0A931GUG0_9BACT|nr:hypothetical protein [Panacibacter microcysteis]MBG9375340.1 hypothetical protein [Panacibacter microcysteis]